MTANDLLTLYRETFEKYAVSALEAGEFTPTMFSKEMAISYNRAAKILTDAVADGFLEEIGERRVDGRVSKAYRKRPEGGADS